jgi:hypothetical protein
MGIIIEDIRYLDKFRPSETDVDWSLYNIGEPFDIEIDYRVEEVAIALSNNDNDAGWILMNPSPHQSGEPSNSNLIFADITTAFANFNLGDDITITGAFQAANDGNYTIIEKINDQTIRVEQFGGGAVNFAKSFLKKDKTIHVITPFKGHKYFFNWVENQAATQFIELSSGEENQLYYDSATTALPATSMVWNGDKTNQIGSTTIEGNGTTAFGQRFTIKHSGSVTPLFLASQIADTQAQLPPDYYESGNCLKHIFKIEVNRDLSNPNDTQDIIFEDREGNTGWFNENYNGQLQNYTISNLTFTRVSDAASLNALELAAEVDADFRITNTVDSPFHATLTKGMAVFWILPDQESRYQDNGRKLEENFVYDYGLNTIATITNGNNFGTTLQAIKEVEMTFVDADNIDVRIRFDFGSLSQTIVNENDTKKYIFGFTIEDQSKTRETSDKTTLLINTNEFELELFKSDLIVNNTKFLFHRFSNFVDGVDNPEVFPVDDMVADSQFSIDFNGLENDGIDILSVSHELVLKHASNADILVESNTYSTGGSLLLDGYVPLIDLEQNRAFTISDNDFRRLVTVKRDDANDSGTIRAYETTYPFFVRWETWEALLGVTNPPAGVYDNTLPNNGLNHFWFRFSTLGYTLNYRLRFTILQNGQQFTQEFDSPLSMNDFNSNPDWTGESIKAFDVDTSTELVSGPDKFLQGYTDTKVVAEFDKTTGGLPPIADIDIVFWIIGKESGTIKSVRRASSVYVDSGDTWFKGITTPTLVDKSKTVSLYKGEILTDFTKLSGSEFTIYARLHNVDTCPADAISLEDDTCLLLEDDNNLLKEA